MIITNSLGSNYTDEDILLALGLLVRQSSPNTRAQLTTVLASMFGVSPTNVHLFSKGRHALQAAFENLSIGTGDEVLLQAFTCAVLPEAIARVGATPLYVDVTDRSLHPTLSSIKRRVTKRTKAAILQHTLGYVNPENDEIVSWCSTNGIYVIQDLAHALGASGLEKSLKFLKVRPRRTSGSDLLRRCPVILSFSQDKVVDGITGGALILPNGSAHRERSIPHISSNDSKYQMVVSTARLLLYPVVTRLVRSTYQYGVGRIIHRLSKSLGLLSSPLDAPESPTVLPDTCAELIARQLHRLDEIAVHRRSIALAYDAALNKTLKLVGQTDIQHGANLRYSIWVDHRDALEERLKRHGFYLLDHWYDASVAPSWHPASATYRVGSCPNAEELAHHIFNLPTHVNISVDQAKRLSRLINLYVMS